MVRRSESDPTDRDERLGEAIEVYLAEAEEGSPPDPDAFAARYPDLSDDLRAALEGLALVRGLVGDGSGSSGPGSRLESGRRIAGYRIVRVLGRGGMGTVYEAVHVDLDRPVALKVLGTHAAPDSTGRRRFLNEARTAAGLHHTHIVPVFDVGQVGGLCYYAMQRIEGSGLDRVLRHLRRDRSSAAGSSTGGSTPRTLSGFSFFATRSPHPAPQRKGEEDTVTWLGQSGGAGAGAGTASAHRAIGRDRDRDDETPPYNPPSGSAYYRWVAEVGREAAEALAHAHSRGIIHRDVKPSNLLVDARGIVWVADFGLARRLADAGLTHHDSLLGTPRYMSPEQARTGPIDGRTDIYSLGATLYELLTLRPPFEGQTAAELVEQIRDRDPAPPRLTDPRIPRDLETIVLKALAKRPADRYATAAALAEDLQRFLHHEPVQARRIGLVGRAWRLARRHPGVTGVSTVAAATVLATAVTAYVRVIHERDQAKDDRRKAVIAGRATADAMREAQAANRQTQAVMREMYLSQATVIRGTSRPNRRAEGLALLKEAAARGPDPAQRTKLRDEAVELLVLRSVVERPEFRTGPSRGLAFGPEGARLATLSDNGEEFSLWDVAGRKRLAQHRLGSPAADPAPNASSPPPASSANSSSTSNPGLTKGTGGRNGPGPGRNRMWSGPYPSITATGEVAVVAPFGGQKIRLFDLITGTPIHDWDMAGRRVVAVNAAPGGHRLVITESTPIENSYGEGNRRPPPLIESRVSLYDLASLDEPIAELDHWTSQFPEHCMVAISPDGQTIATARSRQWTVSLWSAEDGHKLGGDPVDVQAEVTALTLGPDNLLAAAGGGMIRFWARVDDPQLRTPLPSLTPEQSVVHHLRFNPKGTLLAAAGRFGTGGIEIWDPSSHNAVAYLPVPNSVDDLAFSPDGRTLAATSPKANVAVWEVVDPVVRTQISGFDSAPTALAFGADERLAMGSFGGAVRVWTPGQCPTTTQRVKPERAPATRPGGFPPRVASIFFDSQNRLIGLDPEALLVRDLPRFPRRQSLSSTPVAKAVGGRKLFVTRGPWILTWDADLDLNHWQILDLGDTESRRFGRDQGSWRSLAASPAGDRLYLLDFPGQVHVVALNGKKGVRLKWKLPDEAFCLALSPDGATLAVGDQRGNVSLINTARGTVRSKLTMPTAEPPEAQRIWSLAFSPDSQLLAVGMQQGQVDLWSPDVPTAPLLRLAGHRGSPVFALAFDTKGRYLATGAGDKVVDVWDLERVQSELDPLGLAW